MQSNDWAKSLGYAGLTPFVSLALWVGASSDAALLSVLGVYSFGILSFLTGSWWGIGLLRRRSILLIFSNAIFLVAAGSFVLLTSHQWLVASALLFALLFSIESRLEAFARQPAYYRRLRRDLTLGVVTSQLGLVIWLTI